MKKLAQQDDSYLKSTAQAVIGDHCFEVQGRGKGKFAFVLVDNWFHISIASLSATQLPIAYVQISSELLTHHTLVEVYQSIRFIVNTLASTIQSVSVSRLDLCLDFITADSPALWSINNWVTRAKNIDTYSENQHLTGWVIGKGGNLMARLYNKSLESQKRNKDYFYPVWDKNGWNGTDTVWRLEFQFKREVLLELGVNHIDDLPSVIASLWHYSTVSWLRLTLPNKKDTLRSRWKTHPTWRFLSKISWDTLPNKALIRVRKERIPSDDYLFTTGLGAITSYMAREGIDNLTTAIPAYIEAARKYHEIKAIRPDGKFLFQYVSEKYLLKSRKYNTLRNRTKEQQEEEKALHHQNTQHYKKRSNGDE